MPHNDLIAMGLFLAYFIFALLPVALLRLCFKVPFELMRKMLHLIATLSIFPLLYLFSTWHAAVLAACLFALIIYPVLKLIEKTALYRQYAVERSSGEFKHSLIIVMLSYAILIFIYWGILGPEWKYVAIVAVMAWGFGDAAAALVGKRFGRHHILHPWIEGSKTMEGTQAMFVTSGLAIFCTLFFFTHQPWFVSLAIALLVAPVCAAVELFSRRGLDTLTVPFTTGFATLFYIAIFALLVG